MANAKNKIRFEQAETDLKNLKYSVAQGNHSPVDLSAIELEVNNLRTRVLTETDTVAVAKTHAALDALTAAIEEAAL